MTISQFFSQFFYPKPTVQCQPSHQQRQQNDKFSQQIQKLDLQSIRRQHGTLDDRFQKVMEEANIQSAYRVQKCMQQIRKELQKVDSYCEKANKYGGKRQCIQEMDGLILQNFQKPFIKSQLNLYKVANLCLVKGNDMSKCIQEVKKQNMKSLDDSLKNLKQMVNSKCC